MATFEWSAELETATQATTTQWDIYSRHFLTADFFKKRTCGWFDRNNIVYK